MSTLTEALASCHEKIERGLVWCRTCGAQKSVDPEKCIREGWPMCCGHTMTIDAPEERDD